MTVWVKQGISLANCSPETGKALERIARTYEVNGEHLFVIYTAPLSFTVLISKLNIYIEPSLGDEWEVSYNPRTIEIAWKGKACGPPS